MNYVPLSAGGYVMPQIDDYQYDPLNRIQQVSESQQSSAGQVSFLFTQKYAYDRWGNRTIDVPGTTPSIPGVTRKSFVVNTATNRLTSSDGCAMTYDAAGNQTYDCVGTHSYDVENRMTKAVQGSSNNYYFYDASGKRVRRILNGSQTWGGQETWFVYGFDGELAAEYAYNQVTAPLATAPQKEYGYRGGKLLVVWDGTQAGDDQLKWLVADHLGSTRMEANKSGSLTGIRRHDYLPFGEELVASTGAQRGGIGYEPPQSAVRQRFDGYERDSETGLDFAEARYFASMQGRFISPDPFLSSGQVDDPQSWNRYSFGLNNPLRYTDPFGLYVFDSSVTEEQRRKFREGLAQAGKDLAKVGEKYGTNSNEYKKAQRALDVYGEEGKNNGVTIFTKEGAGAGRTGVDGVAGRRTADNPNGQNIRVEFDANIYNHSGLSNLIGHEGSHAADASEWVSSGFAASKNPTRYKTEVDAYTVTSLLLEGRGGAFQVPTMLPHYRNRRGVVTYLPDQIYMYQSSWAEADKATLRRANIDRFLARPRYAEGLYGLTPNNQGSRLGIRGARF
ncbi:MAG: RHS repeat-associated core domain-containing protein [Acidobacteria bacterium]|nr:RHS repeat-associated core domain-containing protein [Acidobacteriota bacterium]